jgi:S1-C subfamily serine protease
MLYITTLTLLLPTILTHSFRVSELGMTQEQKIQKHLRSISIKILAHGETIGSGVLLAQQQQVYTVITNAHVIQAGSVPFQLQTPDGQIYAAALITPPIGQNRDLSILRFQSRTKTYATAKLAPASPKIGDRVWSSGFPLTHVNDTDHPISEPNIVSSQIVQILPIAIAGGYSIGSDRFSFREASAFGVSLPEAQAEAPSTPTIEQGMSGGPLIDRSGKLIGINGVHTHPLWTKPEILEDGSTIGDVLQEQIKNSNWAIPIEFVKEYTRL